MAHHSPSSENCTWLVTHSQVKGAHGSPLTIKWRLHAAHCSLSIEDCTWLATHQSEGFAWLTTHYQV